MDYFSSFRLWLQNHHYSLSTVKNYLSDVHRYLSTLSSDSTPAHIFSPTTLKSYFLPLTADSNLPRYLASINLFCQFAVDQQLIAQNPLQATKKQLQNPPSINLDQLLKQYQTYMESHHHTPATVKNYLADVKRYLSWTPSSA